MSRVSNKKRNQQAKQNVAPTALQWRYLLVICVIMLVFVGLSARAVYIQVIDPDLLIQQGDNRTLRTQNMPVHRGLITDRNGQNLAVSVPVRAIWADPKTIVDNGSLNDKRRWQALADVLGQDYDKLVSRVKNPKKRFVYIQRQVSPAMADYVDQLSINGVYLRDESRRYYPTGEVSAQLIGFTNVDDQGIEGIEKLYNQWLKGSPGSRKIRRDAKGRQVEILEQEAGEEPRDIQLTIDQRIQAFAYKELKKAVQYYKATSASAVVVDVQTGEILAMVNNPSYNPNNRSGVSGHRIRNRAITDAFEPGSSIKPIAVLSALEFGSVEMDSVIDTSPGWMRVGGSMVRDSRNYGELDLTGIIRKSSNMGTSKLALSVPKQFLIDQYYNMGLMSDTGSNLIGESSGIFHDRSRWSEFELSTLSFGYGLSVTTAQLARMYSTLGSGGIKRPLSIIKSEQKAPEERVLSEDIAHEVLTMMESVVNEGGSGTKARVPGYRVAGKTGTSRKAVAGGYGEEYVSIFAGVAPVSDPQLAVVVLINEPRGDLYYAGDTAAPVFSKIMSNSLQMLNVPPDDKSVSSLAAIRGDSNAG
ncbi:peptidoglycan glycosyltransferase FtsI [Paraglaciecola chathamensis]|jgi:cell division protein FtsI (penicillin-binding protein 3)|uniref:Peptidoglycan D,D-transpeptidase FtsI n=3 Tax=Paraglaciecola chathamensis TaxID=368405 RepID=A0ABS0W923_9ALTE|nr:MULTISPECIES: peptidoglycan glycosyltransferase FtsI [Paraglaciecola]AEE21802.1 penicillin-binding protein transpeptidase [Glaciecola sp. 4H-3-7+YE-5]MBN26336.1 peptidoglycan glycosyltransferase FtsI [Alteromonadaceae bacterium]MBJ2135279.1 peptidoglycan glycosyltransferase FtsI [Paraglaciecola chathamensis]MBU3017112.1 peptidoglycan glycosyltransferase FtsI [Paraglaciecola agarilytica]MDO6557860.1 peptidoglycan glycosyltransferase FtsI [Paraglaciecola chathamensis]|tara:strand:- start:52167 stop:53924 length:1758 start_codon:yes stop_codon:yes gene_type:complete